VPSGIGLVFVLVLFVSISNFHRPTMDGCCGGSASKFTGISDATVEPTDRNAIGFNVTAAPRPGNASMLAQAA
jgi:hypothetical protein